MKHILLILICLELLTACAIPRQHSAVAPPAEIVGQVILEGSVAATTEIRAYPVESPLLGGATPYVTRSLPADGQFSLALPEGEYYVLARGEGTYAYYGRNPITVSSGAQSALKLALLRLPATKLERNERAGGSAISGTVLHRGAPLAGVTIYVYTDLTSRLKGMGYGMSVPTETDGRFELELPAGTYYLLARMRHHGGGASGPLQAGDFIGYLADNPVRLTDNEEVRVTIPMFEVPEKVDRLSATLFGQTTVSGRILQRDGTPVAGARALLYDDPRMLNRPLYVSRPSDAEGHYQLSFPSGGRYYLAARQSLGGAPEPGELYGTYDGSPDHSLTIETGQRQQDQDIVVEAMW